MTTKNVEQNTDLSEYYGIETIGITKQFGGVKALDDVSLTIPLFGITSIVGPNGSGKSTFVNLVTGVLPYDDGIVKIETNSFKVIHAHETPEHGITRTFQEVRLFDQMTVWDNMMVVLTNRSLLPSIFERSKAEHRKKTEEILKQVGMWEKRESMAGELSYGQRNCWKSGGRWRSKCRSTSSTNRSQVCSRRCSRELKTCCANSEPADEPLSSSRTTWTSSGNCRTTSSCWKAANSSWRVKLRRCSTGQK